MALDSSSFKIFYGFRTIAPPPLSARISRGQQSAAARRLLSDVAARAPVPRIARAQHRSISHSRGIVAAAVAHGAHVGIDVEFMCPRRNGRAILAFFLGPLEKSVSPAAFYRTWTFGEAYFKVFGHLPDAERFARVREDHADEAVYKVETLGGAAVGVWHSKPFDDFALTIVWKIADMASTLGYPPTRILHDGFGRVRDGDIEAVP